MKTKNMRMKTKTKSRNQPLWLFHDGLWDIFQNIPALLGCFSSLPPFGSLPHFPTRVYIQVNRDLHFQVNHSSPVRFKWAFTHDIIIPDCGLRNTTPRIHEPPVTFKMTIYHLNVKDVPGGSRRKWENYRAARYLFVEQTVDDEEESALLGIQNYEQDLKEQVCLVETQNPGTT